MHRAAGLEILQASALARLPWLVHGFSTRSGGASTLARHPVLNLGYTDWDTRGNVLAEGRTTSNRPALKNWV